MINVITGLPSSGNAMQYRSSAVWSLTTMPEIITGCTVTKKGVVDGGRLTRVFKCNTIKCLPVVGKNGRVPDRFRLLFECEDEPLV